MYALLLTALGLCFGTASAWYLDSIALAFELFDFLLSYLAMVTAVNFIRDVRAQPVYWIMAQTYAVSFLTTLSEATWFRVLSYPASEYDWALYTSAFAVSASAAFVGAAIAWNIDDHLIKLSFLNGKTPS